MASLQESMLKEIADAIREVEGSTGPIPAEEFANRIRALSAGPDTSDANATAADIREGRTAYVRGRLITGTIPSVKATDALIMPGTSVKTVINMGYYAPFPISVRGDANLIPENIKKDVTIFEVRGTYTGG